MNLFKSLSKNVNVYLGDDGVYTVVSTASPYIFHSTQSQSEALKRAERALKANKQRR